MTVRAHGGAQRRGRTTRPLVRCGGLGLGLWLAAGVSLSCPAADTAEPTFAVGSSAAQVVEKLGKPQGIFRAGKWMTYCYEQGMIDFYDGKVTVNGLMSAAELKAKRQAEEDAQRQAEADRQRQAEDGQRELERAAADPALQAKTPTERVAFWKAFGQNHPYTNVSNQLAEAAAALITEGRRLDREATAVSASKRLEEIQARLAQLDADYAASLANWKRNEIDAEQTRLKAERDALLGIAPASAGGEPGTP